MIRGSGVVSRLANYFPARYVAYALFSVAFMVPDPNKSLESVVAFMTEHLGYNPYGYWYFFNEDDAGEVMTAHVRDNLLSYATSTLIMFNQ